jgi:hypothetical protein
MALDAGFVTTNPVKGTGLAMALFTKRIARLVQYQGGKAATTEQLSIIAAQCNDDAEVFVAYLLANAVVTVNVTTSDGALQTSTAAGNPTNPPATNKTLTGTIG